MSTASIRILVTGGTFDKEYNELTGELFFKDSHIAGMLALGRSRLDVAVDADFRQTSYIGIGDSRI